MSGNFEVLPVGTAARLAQVEAERDALKTENERLNAMLSAANWRRAQEEHNALRAERDALRADVGRWAPLLHAAGRVLQAVDDGYLQPDPETLQGGIAIDALREAWGTFAPARIKRGGNG